MSHNNYDEKLKEAKRNKRMKIQLMAEAERERFEAKNENRPPKIHISYGFSELDIFTNINLTWDLYIKFPFAVPKDKCERFKEAIQIEFEKIFLS